MSAKIALIIANTEYSDPALSCLSAPIRDAEELERVLKAQSICAFDEVKTLLNQPESVVRGAIDEFFDRKKSDDLLLLYFSGHGVRDEYGMLYLAVKDTNRFRLRSTAVKSDFIREAMDQSRSRRQVLILDCCNSGAFAQGTKAVTGSSMGIASAFEGTGYGHVVLTASDSTQFAWEGEKIIGDAENSLFTHFLVKGLDGEADIDGDGRITVDELYEYAYSQIVSRNPKQTPSKWSFKEQGDIVLREDIPPSSSRRIPLPLEIINAIESPLPYVREGVVLQLAELISGKNLGLARSAREALEKIAAEDDSRRVSQAAARALISIEQGGQREFKKEAEFQMENEASQDAAQRIDSKKPAGKISKKPAPELPETQIDAKEASAKVVHKALRRTGGDKAIPESTDETYSSKRWFGKKWIKVLVASILVVMILIGASFGFNALVVAWRDRTPTPRAVVMHSPTSVVIPSPFHTTSRTPTRTQSRTPTKTATVKPQLTSTPTRTRTPLPTWTPTQPPELPHLSVSPLGDCSSFPQGTQCTIQVSYSWEPASSGSHLCLYVETRQPETNYVPQSTLNAANIGDPGMILGEPFVVHMVETNEACAWGTSLPSYLQISSFPINR